MANFDPDPAPPDESPVLSGLSAPPSIVARREGPWAPVLGAIGVAVLGLVVFSSLSQGRRAHAQTVLAAQSTAPATTAMATLTPPMPPPAPTSQAIQPSSGLVDPSADPRIHWRAPALVVDLADDSASAAASPEGGAAPAASARADPPASADGVQSADDRFADRVSASSANTTRATRLRDTALIAPQGTVIPAVLETAVNLDLPGFVRAVVSRDVRGFDGSAVLIPRGSRLIGQYRAGVAVGQTRAFIVWSRVLTPDGVSVDIGSPVADRLGRGGLEGETNTHFFRRFGSSILLSVLSAGLEAAAKTRGDGNSATAIVIGSPQQANNIAAIALQKEINIPDTINVAQGTPIRVFLARDLDFSAVVQKSP